MLSKDISLLLNLIIVKSEFMTDWRMFATKIRFWTTVTAHEKLRLP